MTDRKYFRETVSATFYGRDVFAPVAAHISAGTDLSELGPATSHLNRLRLPTATVAGGTISGVVIMVDRLGNLITNILGSMLATDGDWRVSAGSRDNIRVGTTYADAAEGEPIAVVNSFGLMEIAVTCGDASTGLGIALDATVVVTS